MKIIVALIFSLFALSLHAAKPPAPNPSTDKVFVGYSSGSLSNSNMGYAIIEGPDLCRATFGDGATFASSAQIKAAIDDGSFELPSSDLAVILPSDIIVAPRDGVNFFFFDSNLHRFFPQNDRALLTISSNDPIFGVVTTLNLSLTWRVACVQ